MRFNIYGPVTFALLFCAGLNNSAYAQNNSPSRGIPSDDFAKSRPETPTNDATIKRQPPAAKTARDKSRDSIQHKETYKLARVEPKAFRPGSTSKLPTKVTSNETLSGEELGVTVWFLRSPRVTDEGPRIPVKTDEKRRELWTPTRVGA